MPKKDKRTKRVVFYLNSQEHAQAVKNMQAARVLFRFDSINEYARYAFFLGLAQHTKLTSNPALMKSGAVGG